MALVEHKVESIDAGAASRLPSALQEREEPLVLKGFVAGWPVVAAGRASAVAAADYLKSFYRDATVGVFVGRPGSNGRMFYNDDMSGFNYQRAMAPLDAVLDRILAAADQEGAPAIYVGSTSVDSCLPGFRSGNDVDFGECKPLASIWIGTATRIAAHYDLPDNVACSVVGRRRFTLFPPDQLENLYVGPLDFTPAGQAISLVDFENPDYERFPKFRKALEHARVAELDPGDALYIPGMWWHHVEAFDALNVLVNYWWRDTPEYLGTPSTALTHALLTVRNLPPAQRAAWRQIFDYYVFEASEDSLQHIPAERRGILGELDETTARRIRADLLNRLNQ